MILRRGRQDVLPVALRGKVCQVQEIEAVCRTSKLMTAQSYAITFMGHVMAHTSRDKLLFPGLREQGHLFRKTGQP
jgi:hypothetical protein